MPLFVSFLRMLALLFFTLAVLTTSFSFDERFPLEPALAILVIGQAMLFCMLLWFFASVTAASYRSKGRVPALGAFRSREMERAGVPA